MGSVGGAGRNVDDMVALLQHLKTADRHETVRGHADSVLESLEAWREEMLQRMIAREAIRFGLEGIVGD